MSTPIFDRLVCEQLDPDPAGELWDQLAGGAE
jgi:hypothetical protein